MLFTKSRIRCKRCERCDPINASSSFYYHMLKSCKKWRSEMNSSSGAPLFSTYGNHEFACTRTNVLRLRKSNVNFSNYTAYVKKNDFILNGFNRNIKC